MNNYNPFGYSPMTQPQYQQPIQQPAPVQQAPYQNGGQFYFVSSKDEAEKWIVGQGQTVYLFDTSNDCFYIKAVAKNGLPQPLECFAYKKVEDTPKEVKSVEYATVNQLNEVVDKLESEIKKLKPAKKGVKKDE